MDISPPQDHLWRRALGCPLSLASASPLLVTGNLSSLSRMIKSEVYCGTWSKAALKASHGFLSTGFLFPLLVIISFSYDGKIYKHTKGRLLPAPENANTSPQRSVRLINGNCLGISGTSGDSAVFLDSGTFS